MYIYAAHAGGEWFCIKNEIGNTLFYFALSLAFFDWIGFSIFSQVLQLA